MAIIAELKDENGAVLATLMVDPKEFKTGSRGYYANKKAEINGKRYQIQVQIVEIGSKSRAAEE